MPMTEWERLVHVMDALRSDDGCPWYREHTHRSLAHYAIEETYELIEAIETGDRADLRSELGDVLLQVVLHARLAQEHPESPFGIEDVARACADKLVERNPHVFADERVADADEVRARYEGIKARTMVRGSVMDGIPVELPALQRAQKVLERAERSGLAPAPVAAPPATVGERLLALAVEASGQGVDAEAALREEVRRLEHDARETERERARRMEA